MPEQIEIPDHERRETLESKLSDLKRARSSLSALDPDEMPGESSCYEQVREGILDAVEATQEELDGIPEWNTELVRTLVKASVNGVNTDFRTVEEDLVMEFEHGTYDNKKEFRYETVIGGDNEWFFVRGDSGWEEVWTN